MNNKQVEGDRKSFWLSVISLIIAFAALLSQWAPVIYDKYTAQPKKTAEIHQLISHLSDGLAEIWLIEYSKKNYDIKTYQDVEVQLLRLQAIANQLKLGLELKEILEKDINDQERAYFIEYPPSIFAERIADIYGKKAIVVFHTAGFLSHIYYAPGFITATQEGTGSSGKIIHFEEFLKKNNYNYCSRYINNALLELGCDIRLPIYPPNDYFEYKKVVDSVSVEYNKFLRK